MIQMSDLIDAEAFPNQKRLIALMKGRSTNEMYMCDSCGKLDFPLISEKRHGLSKIPRPKITRKDKRVLFEPNSQFASILLDNEESARTGDINTLLKFSPEKLSVQDVITKLRYPIHKSLIESGILLTFKSHTAGMFHKFLIDPTYQDVKFFAVHNDKNAFDLNNLSSAYGEFKYAQFIEHYRFWFFEGAGVAFVTPAKAEEQVTYVQFFKDSVTYERYLELQCFYEETFT